MSQKTLLENYMKIGVMFVCYFGDFFVRREGFWEIAVREWEII